MKTAEEVAEEVWKAYCQIGESRPIRKIFVDALTAYAEERVKEALVKEFEGEDCTVARLEQEAYIKGSSDAHKNLVAMQREARAEALEEAAKVAKTYYDWKNPDFPESSNVEIELEIRALKAKP